MFGHQYTNSQNTASATDLTRVLDKIEVEFGLLHIVFEEDYSTYYEGAWSFRISDLITDSNSKLTPENYTAVSIEAKKTQIKILQALKEKDIHGLIKCFSDGLSARAIKKILNGVIDKYRNLDKKPGITILETNKSPDPLDDTSLDKNAIGIKRLLCSQSGYDLRNFILKMQGKIIHGQYYCKAFSIEQSDGEKVTIRLRNKEMADVINMLKNNDVMSLADFFSNQDYDGKRIALALKKGRITPEVKEPEDNDNIRFRLRP